MPLIIPSNSISAGGYVVDNSLRFNDGSSDYLNRTPGSTSNRRTFTISTWFKRSGITGANQRIFEAAVDGSSYTDLRLKTTEVFTFYTEAAGIEKINLTTNRVLRDTSAWYHVVIAVDTTQGTASDRVKMYINGVQETSFSTETYPDHINGVQETSFSTETYPDQNFDTYVNYSSAKNVFGRRDFFSDFYFDGSMSHIHLIDGTAYDATAFGETDATTGIWKPKTAPSVTYGTNGFFLKFENSGAFGTDSSGNANNFTVNGTMTQNIDTPSNVFATLNSLMNNWTSMTNGNLTVSSNSQAYRASLSTLAVSSGKYYCEVKIDLEVGGTYPVVGIADVTEYGYPTQNNLIGSSANGYGFYMDGNYYNNNSDIGNWGNATTGDIIGLALDLDSATKTIKVYLNGTLSATQTINNPISAYAFGCSTFQADNVACSWNFGRHNCCIISTESR
jgi:hypothetical protein